MGLVNIYTKNASLLAVVRGCTFLLLNRKTQYSERKTLLSKIERRVLYYEKIIVYFVQHSRETSSLPLAGLPPP